MADIRPDTQNRVTLRPVTDAKLEAQDFGQEKIGRGLAAFGQGLAQVAEDVDAIEAIHDEAAVKRIDVEALAAAADAKREVDNAKGEQALTAGEQFASRIENIRKEALSKLSNPRQKRMFSDIFERRAVADTAAVNARVDQETFVWKTKTTGERILAYTDRAIDSFDEADPTEFDAAIKTIVSETEQLAQLTGTTSTLKEQKDKAVGAAYAGVVERTAVENPLKARAFLDEHAGKIPADLETALRKRLQPAFEEERNEIDAERAMGLVGESGLISAVDDVTTAPETQPDPVKAEKSAAVNADPLRGRGQTPVKGGEYGAARDGGERVHLALDYPAKEGTPVYPRGKAKVTEIDKIGKTNAGYYVKLQYADGTYGSYSHLRNINVEVGQSVDADTVVGGVGRTGKGGKPQYGSHLHEVIRNAKDQPIDPRKYRPGEEVGGKAEPGYSPKYEGNTVDIKAAYAMVEKLAKEEGWSLARKKGVMASIDDRARREDVIKDREYEAAEQVAIEAEVRIIQGGGDITKPETQIPNFENLSPSAKRGLLVRAASNRAAIAAEQKAAAEAANKATIEGNYPVFLRLSGMADTNPEQFMKVPIDSYRGSLPDGDWKALKRRQEEYRRQGTYRPQLAPERSKVAGLVNSVLGDAMLDPKKLKDPDSVDSKRRAYLIDKLMREVDARQQSGQKLTDAQIMEVMKPLLRKVVVESPGFFGTSEEEMPWYRAQMEGNESARVAP